MNLRFNPADLARLNAQVTRRRQKRIQQERADDAEKIIGNQLRAFGFVEVAKIETGRDRFGNHVRKVAGDWTFLAPWDGRGGLCEVKSHQGRENADGDRRLKWSDLRTHQPVRLDSYVAANAWAFLAWVGPHGVCLLSWRKLRARGFAPRSSLGFEECRSCETLPYLAPRPVPV